MLTVLRQYLFRNSRATFDEFASHVLGGEVKRKAGSSITRPFGSWRVLPYSMLRPDHESEYLVAITKSAHPQLQFPVSGLPSHVTPLGPVVEITSARRRGELVRGARAADGGCAVEMRVDDR